MTATKTFGFAAALLTAVFAFSSPSVEAAPMTPGQLLGTTADSAGLVEQVHGRHRSCTRTARGGWHYHTRRGRSACAPRRARPAVILRTPRARVIERKRAPRVVVPRKAPVVKVVPAR